MLAKNNTHKTENASQESQSRFSDSLSREHYREWRASNVAEGIIKANVKTLKEQEALSHLLYSSNLSRTNTGILSAKYLKTYSHVEHGGWWCGSLDPQNDFEPMLWGCFKPDRPRPRWDKKHKHIKYEHPPKTQARAFLLGISACEWRQIARRWDVLVDKDLLELPLEATGKAFWKWVLDNPQIPLVITEGAKKAGCLLSQGYVAIGLPGVSQGFRRDGNKRDIIPELKPFLGERDIYMCFDSDAKRETRRNVERMLKVTANTIAKSANQTYIIELPLGKESKMGVDDYIAEHGSQAFQSLFSKAKKLYRWLFEDLYALTYEPNAIINQKYIGEDVEYPTSGLVCIQAPKGTGKTEKLKKVAAKALEDCRGTLILVHRIQLGRAIVERLGLDWVEDVKTSEMANFLGYGLCVDSLHPNSQAQFKPENYNGWALVIDEVEQVVLHLLNSSTCQRDRVSILKTLRELVNEIIEGGGLIVLQDADLSDLAINFFRGLLSEPIEPWLLVNEYMPDDGDRWDVTYYNEGREPNELLKDCWDAAAAGEKLYVFADTQKIKGKHSTQNLERSLRKKAPNAKILRLDSETVADPDHAAYGAIENLNEVVTLYDIVIASPSVGTGVSIDVRGHFNAVYAFCKGTTSEPEIRQALARVREPIPRFVWARTSGVRMAANRSPFYWNIANSKIREVERNSLLLKAADIGDIGEADFHPSYHTWAKAAARTNAGLLNLREALLDGLCEEGHRVKIHGASNGKDDTDNADAAGKEQKEIRDTAREQDDIEVASATPLTKEQFEQLDFKRNHTKEERQAMRRYQLTQLYPGTEVTPELKRADDDGWRPKIRLHYNLITDFAYVNQRDKKQLDSQIERGFGQVCLQDLKLQSARVRALQLLNIPAFMKEGKEWTQDSTDLQALVENCRKYRHDIKTYLGIWVSDKMLERPIQVIQAFLQLVGIKLKCRQQQIDKVRSRFYFYETPQDCRWEVFEAWAKQDREAAEFIKGRATHPPLASNTTYIEGCAASMGVHLPSNLDTARDEGVDVQSLLGRLQEILDYAGTWVEMSAKDGLRMSDRVAIALWDEAEQLAEGIGHLVAGDYWERLVALLFAG